MAPLPTPEPQYLAPDLPAQLTRFIGRAQELADLVRILPTCRLLTLTGAGGSGKTRLAHEAASLTQGRFDGVAWVDLASEVDGGLIPQQVALALQVSERPGVATTDVLARAIGSAHLLLVLDNCEHLVEATAGFAGRLLRACPRLAVMATSREALGIPGETAWLVPPLASAEAVELFVERAQAVLPTFSLVPANQVAVREICHRLDGIPLAIELAAARVRVLTPEQIAERLNESFTLLSAGSRMALPRHRTLRATMDWSYGLLEEREKILLRRLSVFASSFTLDAAEAICVGPPLGPDELLDSITTLVDKSLVILDQPDGEARYRMLETLRQYADEHLATAGERDDLRLRHAEYYLAMAEHAAPRLFGGAADPALLVRLAAETGNLRAVADWAMEDPARSETALRLGAALHWFWFAKGRFEEGRQRLTQALDRDIHLAPPDVRAWALIALGHVHIWQGNPRESLPRMEEALLLLRDLDDPEGLAYALNGVGAAIYLSGDPHRCVPYFTEALPIAERLENQTLAAIVLYYHGRAAQDRGEYRVAREAFERATRIGRAAGNRPAIAHPLAMEGRLAYVEGRYPDALACLGESLEIHDLNDDPWGLVLCLEGIAYVTAARGRHAKAARLLGAAAVLRERMAAPIWPTEQAEHAKVTSGLTAALGPGFDPAFSEGRHLPRTEAVALAMELARAGATATHPVPAVTRPRAPALANAPADLEVRTLGPLRVSRLGTAIDPAAWGSARPRELLVLLLLHPEGCTKEQVGLALWPESSTAQVRNSFHVTLHRLRKALGRPEWVVTAHERYQIDPALRVDFDARRFEREVTGALRALTARAADAPEALARALERYSGDFLESESAGDWHLSWRDRFQRLFVDGVLALSAHLVVAERYTEAAEACRRALDRDPLLEEAWRRLMLCLARTGERAQALRLYQQLVNLLRTELEADPDEQTTALFQRIQSGNPV